MLEKFHDSARFFPSKNDLDDFVSLIIVALISSIIDISSSILYFELESVINIVDIVLIILSIEKLFKDNGLIISKCKIFTSDERREQSKMLCGCISFIFACLLEERLDLGIDYFFIDHVLD
jgi:hypothetical protein